MNRTIIANLLALAAAAATTSAFADDITIDAQPFVSVLSRSEVLSELARFRAAGQNPWSGTYNPLAEFRSTRTRAEVTAEFLQSLDEVARQNADDGRPAVVVPDIPAASAPVLARQ